MWEAPAGSRLRSQSLSSRHTFRSSHSLTLPGTLAHQAQRIRARGAQHFRRALTLADVIVTPSTPCMAPTISAAAAAGGASDLGLVSKIMRFASQVGR